MRVHVLFGLRRATAGVAVCGLALATLVAGGDTAASAAPATSVVVNEVYGGGGNSGATYTNDFVELTNRSDAAVSLDGWSVQYHSGGATGAWQVTPLSGSIAPGAFYLVGEAKGSGGGRAEGAMGSSSTTAIIAGGSPA